MIKNYIIVIFRSLMRHKIYFFVNVSSLAIGATGAILIGLFVIHELSYDKFHKKSNQIYRVLRETKTADGDRFLNAGTSGPLAEALVNEYPEIVQSARRMGWGGVWVQHKEKGFMQRFSWVDSNFLQIFDFPLVKGDNNTVLKDPHTILLTEKMAKKYFGQEDPIGKTISVKDRYFGGDYIITGILRDIPTNSHIQFDFLSSSMHQSFPRRYWHHWRKNLHYRPIITYVVLSDQSKARKIETKLPDFIERHMGKDVREKNVYHLQPLTRTYLYSHTDYGTINSRVDHDVQWRSDIRLIYMLILVAGFVSLISCANFLNLSTARLESRTKEIGLRKAVGAFRHQIICQLLFESVLLAFIACLIALPLVQIILPYFNILVNKDLSFGSVDIGWLLLGIFLLLVFIGIITGSFSALLLSKVGPVEALKRLRVEPLGSKKKRKILVVLQFALAVVLMTCSAIMHKQINFMIGKDVGYKKEEIIIIPIFHTDRSLSAKYNIIKGEFLRHPQVTNASASLFHMNGVGETIQVRLGENGDQSYPMWMLAFDENFLETLQIPIFKGRNFSKDIISDKSRGFILNEAAVNQLGWENPIGRLLSIPGKTGIVIGVVRDFHFRPLMEEVTPTVMHMWIEKWNFLYLKVAPHNRGEVMDFLEDTWQRFIPERPFTYSVLEDDINLMYKAEKKFSLVIALFSFVGIFLACFGLFGLSAYMAEKRTKEIGIRKVLGAVPTTIFALFLKEYLRLVLVGNVIAWPVTFYIVNQWLENFAYRIEPQISHFLLSSLITFVIAIATVSYYVCKASLANPVDSLRLE